MFEKVILALLVLGALAIFGVKVLTPELRLNQPAQTGSVDPNLIQIDLQDGAQVTATYQIDKSTANRSQVLVEVVSESADLNSYDYQRNIVWADSNIEPLLTIGSKVVERDSGKLVVEMTFMRRGSHHHLLVNELGGIKNRVLHFYL